MIKTSYEVKIPRFYESNFLCVKEIENFFQNLKRLQLLLLKTVWFQFIMAFTTFMSTWTIKWVMHRQLVGHIGGEGCQPTSSFRQPTKPTHLKPQTQDNPHLGEFCQGGRHVLLSKPPTSKLTAIYNHKNLLDLNKTLARNLKH